MEVVSEIHGSRDVGSAGIEGDAAMPLMRIHSGASLGVTFCQVLPSSVVRLMRPSSEPTQMSPAFRGDSSTVKMVS